KNIVSVTVTGKDAIRSDAIATAIFVLGKKNGMEFIETIPGYECLLLDENLKVFKSSGFDKSWKSGHKHTF
ncbi:MAG: FAD:protein FMN transferase, partial [Deltaproteobacteria bacterium]|nr:FAD:protein FMN transferase [Deltaproteobacteria bacterium]